MSDCFFCRYSREQTCGDYCTSACFEIYRKALNPVKGKLWALEGNLPAFKANCRFIDKDLNWIWYTRYNNTAPLAADLIEVREREALKTFIDEIFSNSKSKLYLFDLHTTSTYSIPFFRLAIRFETGRSQKRYLFRLYSDWKKK
ncbi:MAG: succinylglutamate desuccinylase/aspartoacylase family protein [Bacteroidetes bacterium]|nr:succinylglutamate desuccinylase/aspartoacylase family protein [Bacteroidota bacterium]